MSLRRAALADMAAVAVLHRLIMRTALPFVPDIHSPEDDQRFFHDVLLPTNQVWVAEAGGAIVGYAAWSDGWLNHLYIHPDHHGQGLGDALLAKAMAGQASLQLWAFQKNVRARRFYEKRGFSLVRLTDGSGNDEREPDALYQWRRGRFGADRDFVSDPA
jgi:putative acetyltransferase